MTDATKNLGRVARNARRAAAAMPGPDSAGEGQSIGRRAPIMCTFADWCWVIVSRKLRILAIHPSRIQATPHDVTTMSTTGAADSGFQPDRAWWENVFAVVDAGDAERFVELLTADGQFRFGNAPAILGGEAIRGAVAGFFAAISSSRHRLLGMWNGPGTAVCEGEVTYTRRNGSTLRVPFVNVFDLYGDKIAAYRIYIDNSGLFNDAP
jgi:ketosteroid isomerase-like protein